MQDFGEVQVEEDPVVEVLEEGGCSEAGEEAEGSNNLEALALTINGSSQRSKCDMVVLVSLFSNR